MNNIGETEDWITELANWAILEALNTKDFSLCFKYNDEIRVRMTEILRKDLECPTFELVDLLNYAVSKLEVNVSKSNEDHLSL